MLDCFVYDGSQVTGYANGTVSVNVWRMGKIHFSFNDCIKANNLKRSHLGQDYDHNIHFRKLKLHMDIPWLYYVVAQKPYFP